MDRGPWLGTVDRRLARPAHPPCPYPGNERRQLSPQAEPPQTNPDRRTLDPIPNAPRGRRAASATLQRPSTPKSHNNRPAIYWPTFTPTHWPGFAPPLTLVPVRRDQRAACELRWLTRPFCQRPVLQA